jgi:hypothetical protein
MRPRIPTSELPTFRNIAATKSPYSFISGLMVDPQNICVYAHVLNKKMYPGFRLKEENIVFLTQREHELYDQGTEFARELYAKIHPSTNWKKIYDLREELLTQYKQLKYEKTFKKLPNTNNDHKVLGE